MDCKPFDNYARLLKSLADLTKYNHNIPVHSSGGGAYTELMIDFLMHDTNTALSLWALYEKFNKNNFPAASGHIMVRSMFELYINAIYISQEPAARSKKYIEFKAILNYKRFNACEKIYNGNDAIWKQHVEEEWSFWKTKESEVKIEYERLKNNYSTNKIYWAGITIKDMAKVVGKENLYNIIYSNLSSSAHCNIGIVNQYKHQYKQDDNVIEILHQPRDIDINYIFQYACRLFSSFLSLFSKEFNTWTNDDITNCWKKSGNPKFVP